MIHVIAIITAKPGKRDEILKNFKANVPAVHAEKGCIEVRRHGRHRRRPVRQFGARYLRRSSRSGRRMDDLEGAWCFGALKAYSAKNKDLVADRAVLVLSPV